MSKADDTQPLVVMGLMSGTSVDGVDACLARLSFSAGRLQHEMLATHSQPMPEALRARLLTAMAEPTVHLAELCALNVAVGELFADTALALMATAGVSAKSIDAIGSHGQTLYHWPPTEPGQLGGTLQIGEPSIIAEKTGVYTIADFRPRDMAAGGQGAPLVCFADWLLFQEDDFARCVQNIGGIGNVTVLPARNGKPARPVIAFDTGPGNMLMDAAATHFFNRPYDADGGIAARGQVNAALLAHLLDHPYFPAAPPKTTGREQFGQPYLQACLSTFPEVSPEDWLATLNRFTADTIVNAYEQFVFPAYPAREMIIGGGGAKNPTLLQNLREGFLRQQRDIALRIHQDFGIPDQYKEALAFAILAWASLLRRSNTLPDCTGAAHPVILGKHVLP